MMPNLLDKKTTQIKQWVAQQLHTLHLDSHIVKYVEIPGDASERRYYRIYTASSKTYILSVLPQYDKSSQAFIQLSKHWLKIQVIPEFNIRLSEIHRPLHLKMKS
ncbi:MAG: hypothetical protein HAW62_01280 [Endozoicomonadaceae bacterium]|nr:hypothetical protein [Endozoicomonadaceae bacterium]